jgi:hypothetical protein
VISGLPSGVNIQVTALSGTAELIPAVFPGNGFFSVELMTRFGGFASGTFNWIAIPSS